MDSPHQARDDSLAAALSPDKHGSEEWGRSPTQELASPSLGAEVRASHTKPPMAAPDQGPPQEGNLEPTPPEYSNPTSWSTPDVVNWLEDLRWVPAKAIDLVTELGADGQFLNTLINSSDCSTVLENDFGIKQVTHRLLFVSKLRGLQDNAAKAAAKLPSQAAKSTLMAHPEVLQGQNSSSTARRPVITGEKAICIPGYPKERDNYEFPTAVEFKAWMMALKVWASIESSGYARAISQQRSNLGRQSTNSATASSAA